MKSKDKNGNLIDYVIKSDATKNISDTVTLDGLCLMMRKNVWQEFKFDEKNIRGFHYYDLDISIRVLEKYRLVVCHDIFIEHLSAGNFGTAWIDETFLFHEKFRDRLPLSVTAINAAEKSSLESFAMKRFLEKCSEAKRLNLYLVAKLILSYPAVAIKNLTFAIRLKNN